MFARIGRWWRNIRLKASYISRLSWLEGVMAQVEEIANSANVKAGLPDVAERVAYLQEHAVMGMPRIDESGQLRVDYFTECRANPPLLIFPILRSDASISPVAAYLREHAQPASYSPHGHMIILGMDEKETFRFQATSVLHETGHALYAQKEGRILTPPQPRDERIRLEEELLMWHFDCRLAIFLGGQELKGHMDTTVQQIIQGWVTNSPFQVRVGATTPLDLCYGPVTDQGRCGARTVLYMRYCELIALHIFYGPLAAQENQLSLIASFVGENWKKQKELLKAGKK